MAIRILTKNGIENTNIDGARDNNFNAGRKSGIVKSALNEGNLYGTSNTLTLEPCELRLCGHRVVIDENENRTFTNRPQTATKQSLIAQIQVDESDNVVFDLIMQNSSTALVQDNLDISGNGTYQLEIGTFTQNTDGTISNVTRTAELITSASGVVNKANADATNLTNIDGWLSTLKSAKFTKVWSGNLTHNNSLSVNLNSYDYVMFIGIKDAAAIMKINTGKETSCSIAVSNVSSGTEYRDILRIKYIPSSTSLQVWGYENATAVSSFGMNTIVGVNLYD